MPRNLNEIVRLGIRLLEYGRYTEKSGGIELGYGWDHNWGVDTKKLEILFTYEKLQFKNGSKISHLGTFKRRRFKGGI